VAVNATQTMSAELLEWFRALVIRTASIAPESDVRPRSGSSIEWRMFQRGAGEAKSATKAR
jgi:hypothetical protein